MGVPRKQMVLRLSAERSGRRQERRRVHDGHLAAVGMGRRSGFFRDVPREDVEESWNRIVGGLADKLLMTPREMRQMIVEGRKR